MKHPSAVAVSVVVPVYKEEASIRPFLSRMEPVLERIGRPYEIIFCLDPSPDRTEEIICEEAARNPAIGLLRFSRRFRQPAATLAGILNSQGEWTAVIDVDLQDPPELIADMLEKAESGPFDVVTAKRTSREGETPIKRAVSYFGYKILNDFSEVSIPRNTGDFRIMNRRIVEELRRLQERHGFLRGMVSLVGYRQAEIEYERDARLAGKGNYNRHLGSLKIGFNGLFGFSVAPLQIMMWSGFVIALLSVMGIMVVFLAKIMLGDAYPMGVPTIIVLVLFMGGVQLAAIGVLGEYIGRIYDEVRQRPLYIVERAVNVVVRDSHGPLSGIKSDERSKFILENNYVE